MSARLQLWRRRIPRFPLYFKDDPQRHVLLPQFWMKLLKPSEHVPPDTVHFEIHPQMSKADVKQYLEKIYQVDVAQVRTEIRRGLKIHEIRTRHRHEDQKYAYVQLYESTYEFPDVNLGSRRKERMQNLEEDKAKATSGEAGGSENKTYPGVPRWFR